MSNYAVLSTGLKSDWGQSSRTLAASIIRAASKQTYYIVRFLVDRDRVSDACRAYAYFRWVDDYLDQEKTDRSEGIAFINRQQKLLDCGYRDEWPDDLRIEECMLADLVRGDKEVDSSLRTYLCNMMAVMAFDAERRGRLISQQELADYTRLLATAVTEALHYFIGHDCVPPQNQARYLAAAAAHITHMLRDTVEDVAVGYYNIPCEYLDTHRIGPQDVESEPYRAWVQSRIQLARRYFKTGQGYLAQVQSLRCRLAGYLYMARFEPILDAIEQEGYRLRAAYPECKTLRTGITMGWSMLSKAFIRGHQEPISRPLPVR